MYCLFRSYSNVRFTKIFYQMYIFILKKITLYFQRNNKYSLLQIILWKLLILRYINYKSKRKKAFLTWSQSVIWQQSSRSRMTPFGQVTGCDELFPRSWMSESDARCRRFCRDAEKTRFRLSDFFTIVATCGNEALRRQTK